MLLKACVAAVLALSIARAFFGPPARTRHRHAARWILGYAVALYVLAGEALLMGREQFAAVLVVAGVEGVCLAMWLGGYGEDDGGDARPPDPEPPIDWEACDRERARWRPREPVA